MPNLPEDYHLIMFGFSCRLKSFVGAKGPFFGLKNFIYNLNMLSANPSEKRP